MTPKSFSQAILRWFDLHGRKNLPWQQDTSAYRVWVSEIMLQQTQVQTVIPYFDRFMTTFPTVEDLAEAPQDEVLHLWTGLGYYARARNLHRAAKLVCEQYGGEFPNTLDQLVDLPGIGRSTAGAIISIAFKQRAAILDGNVKRVLARFHAVDGWPGNTAVHNELWQYAERYTPHKRVADYTQAMMDLGATSCNRSRPDCPNCPLQKHCAAHLSGEPKQWPHKKPRKKIPVKQTRMLMVQNSSGEVLLEKRPNQGIWGGLWSLPEIEPGADPGLWVSDSLGGRCFEPLDWPELRHTFSHYHLDIVPTLVQLQKEPTMVMEASCQVWYNVRQPQKLGLAAPVKRLLEQL
ncbi:MAG: A/G-specific adenine glycosylase [Pseudomonadales bacterium]